MQLNEVRITDGLPVDGYGPGFFRVGGLVHDGGLRILAGSKHAWSGYDDADWVTVAAQEIDLLLLGTGAEMQFADPSFRDAVAAAGIALEPMPTPSACRTYNVLLSEGRRLGLVVFPV